MIVFEMTPLIQFFFFEFGRAIQAKQLHQPASPGTTMKRILLITAFTPSRSTAGQHYTFNLLQDISMRYQVDVVYFKFKQEEYVPVNSNVRVVATFTRCRPGTD